MKKTTRILCTLLFISLLLVSITSCSKQKNNANTSTTNITPTVSVITDAPTPTTTPTLTPTPTPAPTPTAAPTPILPITVRDRSFDATNLHKSKNGIDTIDDGVMRDISSMDMAKEMGLGINLGNTMESVWSSETKKYSGSTTIGNNTPQDYEKCWGAVVTTQEAIDGMYTAGFDTVRIPVYWGNMMDEDGSMTINEEYFNRVEEIINYCLNNKLYVVINIHHYDGFIIKNFSQSEALEIMGKLWTQIAERYKEYSDYLIFEGYNESLGEKRENDNYSKNEMYDYVNSLNKVFVDSVRATGGNNAQRMLIVSGYWTNIDLTTDSRYIIPSDTVDDRIMVSVHYPDNSYYWMQKIGGKDWINYTKAQCELLKKAFTDKGYAVFLGEVTSGYPSDRFSSYATITETSECIKTMLKLYLDYGFIPVFWDVNDNFYSRTEYKLKSIDDAVAVSEVYSYLRD
jgi:endoglucanase